MEYLNELCKNLIKKHRTRDPAEIAESLGINVWYRDLGGLKGFYLYERKSRYIVINENLDEILARIVAAHELGHDLLHRTLARGGMRDITLFLENNKTERQANLFASELLISDKEIIGLIEDYMDFERAAYELGYPLDLVCLKLECLNHRGYDYRIPHYRSNFLL